MPQGPQSPWPFAWRHSGGWSGRLRAREDRLHEALKKDLNKSGFESYMTETGLTLSELSYMKKHLKGFAKPRRHITPLAQFHGRSFR